MSNRDYLLLIYMFMCMKIFLRIIILSFQSHQIRILSAGLGMTWNRDGLSCIDEKTKTYLPSYHPFLYSCHFQKVQVPRS